MSKFFFDQCPKHGDEFMIGMKRDMLEPENHQEKCPLCKAEARIAELEAENKKLRDALQGLYSHTKNNYQICGLNYRAKRVLEDCWLARNDAQEALKGGK